MPKIKKVRQKKSHIKIIKEISVEREKESELEEEVEQPKIREAENKSPIIIREIKSREQNFQILEPIEDAPTQTIRYDNAKDVYDTRIRQENASNSSINTNSPFPEHNITGLSQEADFRKRVSRGERIDDSTQVSKDYSPKEKKRYPWE